jgi:putative hydrolase of the HAD superfamily
MIRGVIFDCLGVLCNAAWNQKNARNESVIAIVEELHKHHKTALLSNINRGFIDGIFTKDEQFRLFDTVVLSSEAGMAKPSREIYELTAEQLGLAPEECVMIDDIEDNILGAKAAGMQGIVYMAPVQCEADLRKILGETDA